MAFGVTDLKKGQIFQLDGVPYKVVEYSQKVMGRGGSIVNVKIKSLTDGKVFDKTFKGNEIIEPADVSNIKVQFLYADNQNIFLMDQQNFEQFNLDLAEYKDTLSFLKEGDQLQAHVFDGRIINLILPKNLPLQVTYTEDVVKGDTSSAITKEATLETGLKIKVPAFIKQADIVSVDTDSGTYRERIKG